MKFGKEIINEKTCSKCTITLPATTDYFYKHKGGKYGIKAICKPCCDVRSREYEVRLRENRPEHAAYLSYIRNIYIKYRLREQDIRDMMDLYKGLCYTCGASLVNPVWSKGDMHVDHCHSTGKVRGLLCGSCNKILGHIEKKPVNTIVNLLNYLNNHRRLNE